jgi:hypothetical protein
LAEHVYADQNGRHGADHPTGTGIGSSLTGPM